MQLQTEDNGSQLEKPMDIPKELWILVDYLYRNAIQQVGGAEVVTPDRGHAALRKSISPENFGQKTVFPCRTCGTLLLHWGVKVDRFTRHTPIQHPILQGKQPHLGGLSQQSTLPPRASGVLQVERHLEPSQNVSLLSFVGTRASF